MSEDNNQQELDTLAVLQEVVTIVSAYFSHNAMPAADLPGFITAVHASVVRLSTPPVPVEEKQPDNPAVAVKRSVTKDYIVCLEDGKKFKSLRRHLSSFHGMTPDEYRAKWSLASDYPMVAPAYSAVRSRLARDSGLGQMAKEGGLADDGLPDGALDDGEIDAEAVSVSDSEMLDAAEDAKIEDVKTENGSAGTAEAAATIENRANGVEEPAEPADAEAADGAPVTPPKKAGRGRPRKQA